MIVTRVAFSKRLTARKFSELSEIASRLGQIRHELWDRYGSASGYSADPRSIRDAWVKEQRDFGLPARLWKETVRDVFDDIKARRESGFKAVAQKVYRRMGAKEGKLRCRAMRLGTWKADPYLHRLIRKELPRGRTWVENQIVLDTQCYKSFEHSGKGWIEVTGLTPRKRLALPLGSTAPISGTIRLLLRDGRVEVHHQVEVEQLASPQDAAPLGIDKGYTETYVDSDGQHHGETMGALLTAESDALKVKHQRRNTLRAIAQRKPHKCGRIQKDNLGKRKQNRRKSRHLSTLKNVIYKATHAVVRKSSEIVCENLSVPMKSRKQYGKDTHRRLSGWVKGMLQEALSSVSQRYGVPLRLVNPAYTSQMCSCCGFLGDRRGDVFYCTHFGCGVVLQADYNAALNILARSRDVEIHLWMKAAEVKSILLEREQRQRLGLLNLDSSCSVALPLSTESESPLLAQV